MLRWMEAGRIIALATAALLWAELATAATVTVDLGAGTAPFSKTWNLSIQAGADGLARFEGDEFEIPAATGEPQIPWSVVTVLLPPDANLSSLKCVLDSSTYDPVAGTWTIAPQPPEATRDESGQVRVFWPMDKTLDSGRDLSIYGQDAYWPAQQARVLDSGKLRKWQMARVGVPLARYNPATGALTQLTTATIHVRFTRTALTAEQLAVAARPDPVGQTSVRKLAANFPTAAEPYGGDVVQPMDLNSTGYYVLTTAAIKNASTKLTAFVAHKQARGFNAQIVTESTWGGGTGNTAATNIRNWLKANYQTLDIKYVLLIGDPSTTSSAVPMKMGWPRDESPTDFYYAELSGDWDLNANGIDGEDGDWGTGGIDRYWEVLVGRIPYYGSISDLDSILQKTINYDNATDTSWRRRVLVPAVPLDEVTPSFQLGEQIEENLCGPAGIPCHRLYAADFTALPPPESMPVNSSTVLEVWRSTPFGLVTWCTHGSSTSASSVMDSTKAASLNNNYPSAVFHGSCTNANPSATNNLAYSILKNGGINDIGGTDLTYYYIGESSFTNSTSDAGIGYAYSKRITTQNLTTGEAWFDTLQNLSNNSLGRRHCQLFVMYGDPSVQPVPAAANEFLAGPTEIWHTLGHTGGPFSTSSKTYTLTNTHASAINWTAAKTAAWLTVSPSSGTLAAGGSTTVTVTLASAANSLSEGIFTDTVTFTDTMHTTPLARSVKLEIRPKQLVGWWRMDEAAGTSAADSSGLCAGAADLQGGLAFGTNSTVGRFGNALVLDGVDDCVCLPDLKLCTNSATFSAWIKRNGTQAGDAGIIFERSDSTTAGLHFNSTGTQLRYTWAGGRYGSGMTVPDNTWVFVAVAVSTSKATLYLYNGTQLTTWSRTATHGLQYFGGEDLTYVGWDPDDVARVFNGAIDDVRIHNYALDSAAILDLALGGRSANPCPAQGCATTPSNALLHWSPSVAATAHDVFLGTNYNTVLNATTATQPEYRGRMSGTSYSPATSAGVTYYWRVDEVVGTQITKGEVWHFTPATTAMETGLRFRGTMDTAHISGTRLTNAAGDPALDATLFGGPALADGLIGQALVMDGSNDDVRVPALNVSGRPVTFTAWLKRNGSQASNTGIVFARAGDTVAGLYFSSDELRYRWNDVGSAGSGLSVPDGEWVLAALVMQPDQATLYMGADGMVASWLSRSWFNPQSFNGLTCIGWDPYSSSRHFKGQMDEVTMWDRALSAAEIRAIYDVGLSGGGFTNSIVTETATLTIAEGGTAALRVKLGHAPGANVTVTVAHTSGCAAIAVQSGASLVFTPSTWNTYRTATIAAARDPNAVDDQAVIRCSAGGLTCADVVVTQQDQQAGDFDADGDVDLEDFGHLQLCLTAPYVVVADPACLDADLDGNTWVDQSDLSVFAQFFNGPNQPPKTP